MSGPTKWMIRTKDFNLLGPMDRLELMDFLKKGKLSEDDEICSGKGEWFYLREKDYLEENFPGETFSIKRSVEEKNKNSMGQSGELYPDQDDLEFPDMEIEDTQVIQRKFKNSKKESFQAQEMEHTQKGIEVILMGMRKKKAFALGLIALVLILCATLALLYRDQILKQVMPTASFWHSLDHSLYAQEVEPKGPACPKAVSSPFEFYQHLTDQSLLSCRVGRPDKAFFFKFLRFGQRVWNHKNVGSRMPSLIQKNVPQSERSEALKAFKRKHAMMEHLRKVKAFLSQSKKLSKLRSKYKLWPEMQSLAKVSLQIPAPYSHLTEMILGLFAGNQAKAEREIAFLASHHSLFRGHIPQTLGPWRKEAQEFKSLLRELSPTLLGKVKDLRYQLLLTLALQGILQEEKSLSSEEVELLQTSPNFALSHMLLWPIASSDELRLQKIWETYLQEETLVPVSVLVPWSKIAPWVMEDFRAGKFKVAKSVKGPHEKFLALQWQNQLKEHKVSQTMSIFGQRELARDLLSSGFYSKEVLRLLFQIGDLNWSYLWWVIF